MTTDDELRRRLDESERRHRRQLRRIWFATIALRPIIEWLADLFS